jgi:hypothetical protein
LFADGPAAYGTCRAANNSSGGTANSSANYGPTGAANHCTGSFAGAAKRSFLIGLEVCCWNKMLSGESEA